MRLQLSTYVVFLSLAIMTSVTVGASMPDTAGAGGAVPGNDLEALWFESASFGQERDRHEFVLRGPDARHQLVVTAQYGSGPMRDLTQGVEYKVSSSGVLEIDETGLITPLADGTVTVTAIVPQGITATASITVERFESPLVVNYPNQVVPIFTKLSCNSGGCHGKSGGQNGFRLSLLGFEPQEDYEWVVQEARGRRLFPAAPENSLILLKATNGVPHGGGQRLKTGSHDYRLLRRWIMQGMPYGQPDDPTLVRLQVLPEPRTVSRDAEQQICLIAHYSDGSLEDVTQTGQYESNDKDMATVSESGRVRVMGLPGDLAIMVRYQDKATVYRATVPIGETVVDLPEPRNFIDEHVFDKLKRLGMPPSELCDDPTFLRRATLDIAGRLPTVEESAEFRESDDPNKRDKLIDQLLASSSYADFFANKWTAILRNQRRRDTYRRGTFALHDWVRQSLHENKPYDEFVRDIVAASGTLGQSPPVSWYREVTARNERMENVSQLFLGVRIQCAQCHHHPYEKWNQDDYYGMAAFFSQVDRKEDFDVAPVERRFGRWPGSDEFRVYHKRGQAEAKNPRSKLMVRPRGLGSDTLELTPEDDPRHALVDWMVQEDNPFFAHCLANRYWKHFFTRGLVEPEDDMRDTNPPSHPELLDGLAAFFVESDYDLQALIRVICQSTTYQLDSRSNEYNGIDKQNFSRYFPRRLNAEVLLDAIDTVTDRNTEYMGLPDGTRAVQLPDRHPRHGRIHWPYFLTVFGSPDFESACECERRSDANLAQSLHRLNSPEIQEKITSGRAKVLAGDRQRKTEEKIKELYQLAFSRLPGEREMAAAVGLIENAANDQSDRQEYEDMLLGQISTEEAYEDLMWALINTKEFMFNH